MKFRFALLFIIFFVSDILANKPLTDEAAIAYETGNNQQVYTLLKPHRANLDDELLSKFASSCLRLGYYEEALPLLEKLHEKYPENIELLIEYGVVLHHTEAYKASNAVFASLSSDLLPANLASLVTAYTEANTNLLLQTKGSNRFRIALLAGLGYDDNIRNDDTDNLPVNPNAAELADGFHREFLQAEYTLALSDTFHWKSAASLYNKGYFEYTAENVTQVDALTGIEIPFSHMNLFLPIGFSYLWYGHEGYQRKFYLEPGLNGRFNENSVWKIKVIAGNVDYDQDRTRDYDRLGTEGFVNYQFGENYLAVMGHYKSDMAVDDTRNDVSRTLLGGGVTYGRYFPYRVNLALTGKAEYRDYKDEDLFFQTDRDETRWQGNIHLSKSFGKMVMLSLDYKYVNNEASIDYYSYQKNVVTLNGMIHF